MLLRFGLPHFKQSSLTTEDYTRQYRNANFVVGLVLLRTPGKQLTSALDMSSTKELAEWEAWGKPSIDEHCKLHWFDIIDCLVLSEPERAMFDVGRAQAFVRLNSAQVVSLFDNASVQKYRADGQAEPGTQRLHNAFVQWINDHGSLGLDTVDIGDDFNKVGDMASLAFKCLPAMFELMARNAFKRILLTPQAHTSTLSAHPFHDIMFAQTNLRQLSVKRSKHQEPAADCTGEQARLAQNKDLLQPSRFALLSDLLSSEWSKAILSQHPTHRALLEANVTWLRSVESHFAEAGLNVSKPYANRRAYHLRTIIKAVSFGSLLTGDKNMPQAVSHALDMICSPQLAAFYKDMLNDSDSLLKVPSQPTISRYRLMIDTAFMLHMRSRNKVPSSRFGMSDSSPQLRRDWFMMWQCSIPHESLTMLLKSTHYLFDTKGQ